MSTNKWTPTPYKMEVLWLSSSQSLETVAIPSPYGVALILKEKVHILKVFLDATEGPCGFSGEECLGPALAGYS